MNFYKKKMKASQGVDCYEFLSVFDIIFVILLRVVYSKTFNNKKIVYYFFISKIGEFVSNVLNKIFDYKIQKIQFDGCKILDKNGMSIYMKSWYYQELLVKKKIVEGKIYQSFKKLNWLDEDLERYLEKSITSQNSLNLTPLGKKIFMIEALKTIFSTNNGYLSVRFYVRDFYWIDSYRNYLENDDNCIELIDLYESFLYRIFLKLIANISNFKVFLKLKLLRVPFLITFLQDVYYCWMSVRNKKTGSLFCKTRNFRRQLLSLLSFNKVSINTEIPKILVEDSGRFNLTDSGKYSDIFFWLESKIPSKNLLLLVSAFRSFISEEKSKIIKLKGVNVVATSKCLTEDKETFVYKLYFKPTIPYFPLRLIKIVRKRESNLLKLGIFNFALIYNLKRMLALETGTKIHFSDNMYSASHIAITAAMRSINGINIIYQRAYVDIGSVTHVTTADIVFSFSHKFSELEFKVGSKIPYHVVTGYPGDHRSSLLKDKALLLREKFLTKGVKRIIAYFDENSTKDGRWGESDANVRKTYQFLLEKVMDDPNLGIIFKPKKPGTLRKRLGDVNLLVKKIENLGRCYIYEGEETSTIPPVTAALSSDIAIHGYLFAGTAGVECALAGVRTLLFDGVGNKKSDFYSLGEGKVVFTDWDYLWEKVSEYFENPDQMLDFGVWNEAFLNEIDSFRDGLAAKRIGDYLHWLIEGYENKLQREKILSDAAERYCKQWGYDKITCIE